MCKLEIVLPQNLSKTNYSVRRFWVGIKHICGRSRSSCSVCSRVSKSFFPLIYIHQLIHPFISPLVSKLFFGLDISVLLSSVQFLFFTCYIPNDIKFCITAINTTTLKFVNLNKFVFEAKMAQSKASRVLNQSFCQTDYL